MTTAVVPYRHPDGAGVGRARSWADLPDDERRCRAVEACRDHDTKALWDLTDAHLTLYGRAGARISPYTRGNYQRGVAALVTAWRQENLLRPRRDAGALWVRALESTGGPDGTGLMPSTVKVRLAGARALYAALRWAGTTELDPLRDAHPAKDLVPAWEKRHPYDEDEIRRLIMFSTGEDQALVLLGAHAGLRVSEMLALRWDDVDLGGRQVSVCKGKGDKPRTVALSQSLAATRDDLRGTHEHAHEHTTAGRTGPVLPYGTAVSAWNRLKRVCVNAGVTPKGIHSLRHAAGTRVVHETGSLEEAARHLGHASIETTRVYAKWSNTKLKATVGEW